MGKTRTKSPRDNALMRRLNESASWLSDVSDTSEDEKETVPPPDTSDDAQQGGNDLPGQVPNARYLCLAEVMNESATWIDCDISDSDQEERAPAPPEERRGPVIEPCGYRQGV